MTARAQRALAADDPLRGRRCTAAPLTGPVRMSIDPYIPGFVYRLFSFLLRLLGLGRTRDVNREKAFGQAAKMIRRAVRTGGRIVNMRASRDVDQQRVLYAEICNQLNAAPNWEYVRIVTLESDPHLWLARFFLEKAGERGYFRLVYVIGKNSLPSSFISNRKALLGLIHRDSGIQEGVVTTSPKMVRVLRRAYEDLVDEQSKYVHELKGFDKTLSGCGIDRAIRNLASKAADLGSPVAHWEAEKIPEQARREWRSHLELGQSESDQVR